MADAKLTCPSCGWDGSEDGRHGPRFTYLEEVTNERPVVGLNEAGVLQIDGRDHLGVEDAGANHRLQCGNCLAEFALPEGLDVDFV